MLTRPCRGRINPVGQLRGCGRSGGGQRMREGTEGGGSRHAEREARKRPSAFPEIREQWTVGCAGGSETSSAGRTAAGWGTPVGRGRQKEPWVPPHPECHPRSALGADVPPGPKTQVSRLGNNISFSQMKTCQKAGRTAPCPLPPPTLRVLPTWPWLYHSQQFYKLVLLPGSF